MDNTKIWEVWCKLVVSTAKGHWKRREEGKEEKGVTTKRPTVQITWEDIYDLVEKQKFKCAVTGQEINPRVAVAKCDEYEPYHPLAPSLNRIDHDDNYTTLNIEVVLRFINLGLSKYNGDGKSLILGVLKK